MPGRLRHLPALAATAWAVLAACGPSAPSVTYPGISGHSRYLLLAGTPHQPDQGETTCESCHPATSTTFADFTCTSGGCHAPAETDASHAGLTGYAYADRDCYACHPSGTAAPPNHTPDFFPVGSGTDHEGIRCLECHTDLTRPRDPTAFACASCHQARDGFGTAHTVAGHAILVVHTSTTASTPVPLTPASCLRCHADSQVDRVASHPRGESGFGQGDHRTAGCLTCHTGFRSGTKSFGANWDSASGCSACHRDGGGADD